MNRRQTQMKQPSHGRRQVIRIDVLPDDVLLEIFDFCAYADPSDRDQSSIEAWQPLVHVCQRWRGLVLGSPRRLNLHLLCTPKTSTKDTLEVWPAFPLVVWGEMTVSSTDNIIAALGQRNRVRQVLLWYLTDQHWEEVLAAMQVPFPELTDLRLSSKGETLQVIPDSFLDGSAPHLRFLFLNGVLFPGLPKLLVSVNHLVNLWLIDIPHSGYISPEAIVALISVLSSLEELYLGFRSPRSRPDLEIRRPPPLKCSVIPALRSLRFKGVNEYLEDLVTRIDTPQLDKMDITFFNQIDFDTPRLAQFINRIPNFRKRDAHVQFEDDLILVGLPRFSMFSALEIAISCREQDWQLSSIEQVCNSSSRSLSTVEDLYIEHLNMRRLWENDAIENALWLQLLLPFTVVKNLYLSKRFAPSIAAALQELVGGRIMEVLPSLQNIFVEGLELSGPFQKNIEQFVAARQLSNRPIAISDWGDTSKIRLYY